MFLYFRSRKRKKIRVTIIEQISPSDNDDGEIPPPPPGSPPLFSIKEFLARYPSSKSALPIPIVTGANWYYIVPNIDPEWRKSFHIVTYLYLPKKYTSSQTLKNNFLGNTLMILVIKTNNWATIGLHWNSALNVSIKYELKQ